MIVTKKDYVRLRAKNVQDHVSIFDVLDYYGIPVHTRHRQSQYPCPLHGDGSDSAFSARAYPDDNSTYCWACSKRRDCISFVQEKENVPYFAAIKVLEQRYGVPALPGYFQFLDSEIATDPNKGQSDLVSNIEKMFEQSVKDPEGEASWDRTEREDSLRRICARNRVPFLKQMKIWSLFDILAFEVATGILKPEDASLKFQNLCSKV